MFPKMHYSVMSEVLINFTVKIKSYKFWQDSSARGSSETGTFGFCDKIIYSFGTLENHRTKL